MYPILYENSETQFITNGIGRLSDAHECKVHEVRNGEYELTMQYPVTGKYFKELKEWRIIGATHDQTGELQPFDIYKVSRPSHGYIEVRAHHISYRTNKIILIPTAAVQVTCQNLFNLWQNSGCIIGACPFTFSSDVDTISDLNQPNFASIRTYLYGQDDAGILNCFGYEKGEYYLDKFNIYFLTARGQERGKKFRTGKNVRLLTSETDVSDVITAVVPFWLGKDPVSGEKTYTDLRDSGYIVEYTGAEQHAQQLTKQLDLSNVFEQPPTASELRSAAQEWMERHNYNSVHRESYIIQTTAETEADLEGVNLCDIVTVEDTVNDYRVKLKVTETTWDVLKDRYESIVVGDRRPLITETFRRQNAIHIQQISNNQEQISALAKKKAQVEQTVTPTTTGATKIGSVDGTDLYAPAGGGGSSKWGGANNSYGVGESYNASDKRIVVIDKDGVKAGTEEAATNVLIGSTASTATRKNFFRRYVTSDYLIGYTDESTEASPMVIHRTSDGHVMFPLTIWGAYADNTEREGYKDEYVRMRIGAINASGDGMVEITTRSTQRPNAAVGGSPERILKVGLENTAKARARTDLFGWFEDYGIHCVRSAPIDCGTGAARRYVQGLIFESQSNPDTYFALYLYPEIGENSGVPALHLAKCNESGVILNPTSVVDKYVIPFTAE